MNNLLSQLTFLSSQTTIYSDIFDLMKREKQQQNQSTPPPPKQPAVSFQTRLEISNKQLECFPENLAETHPRLKVLVLNNNQLSQFPQCPCFPKTLKKLEIRCQTIQQIPEGFLPDHLETFICNQTKLTELPPRLPSHLTRLNLDNNRLAKLPDNLPNSLLYFSCKHNLLTELPPNLPPFIELLNISYNHIQQPITSLPPSLEEFQCVANGITHISCKRLQEIVKMDVGANNLVELPSWISSCRRLTHFSCNYNQIQTIPALPPNCLVFYCQNNQIHTLPNHLPPQLTDFICYKNNIRELPALLPTSLVKLSCGNNQLIALPNSLKNCRKLKYLYCNDNQITALTATATELSLPELVVLQCFENQLTAIPNINAPKLQELFVCNNRLTELPDDLPVSLSLLAISNNCLHRLPPSLGTLVKLTEFNCSHNQLTELPAVLPPNIGELRCSNNRLTELPAVLPTGLFHLEFNDNEIRQFPAVISTLQSLLLLSFKNNHLVEFNINIDLPPSLSINNIQCDLVVFKSIANRYRNQHCILIYNKNDNNTTTTTTELNCPICYETFNNDKNDNIIVQTNCKHTFCSCLLDFIQLQKKQNPNQSIPCPICRTPIKQLYCSNDIYNQEKRKQHKEEEEDDGFSPTRYSPFILL